MTKMKMTEQEVRRIAREESMAVFEKSISSLKKELGAVKRSTKKTQSTLERLERLLLGEMGVEKEDTLKARATYAYEYAKRNVDAHIIERAIPALDWFEDMNQIERGCSESKLSTLGKMITSWTSIKWLGGLFGVINLATLLGLVLLIVNFIRTLKELGL